MSTTPESRKRLSAVALKGKRRDVTLATKVNFPEGEGCNDRGLSRHNIILTPQPAVFSNPNDPLTHSPFASNPFLVIFIVRLHVVMQPLLTAGDFSA